MSKILSRTFLIVISLFFLLGCNDFGKVMKSKDFDYKLLRADQYFEKKKYKYAQQLYEELFPVFKGTQKFEDLYYKYAYCFYNQELYREAENLFKGYLEVFPNSLKAEEVDFKRAYCFYKQSPKLELEQVNTLKTMGMMQTFINTHPGSAHLKEASEIIDLCRQKLEQKDFRAARLFFDMGSYRAAAIAFNNLLNDYPESLKAEEYKLFVVKSYYKFADLSVQEKQMERYEKVLSEYNDFADRFPGSSFLEEARNYNNLSINKIKAIQNEQVPPSVKR